MMALAVALALVMVRCKEPAPDSIMLVTMKTGGMRPVRITKRRGIDIQATAPKLPHAPGIYPPAPIFLQYDCHYPYNALRSGSSIRW